MKLRETLQKHKVLLADGAMGTLLAERGKLQPGEPPELLNLSDPEAVERVHKDYLEVGSKIILTNTFGANPFKLARLGLARKLDRIIGQGCAIANQAKRGKDLLIAADIGPSGELLSPLGRITPKELADGYRKVVLSFSGSGIDFFLVETLSSIEEGRIIAETIAEKEELPIIISFTFSPGKKGPKTLLGEEPKDVVKTFEKMVFGIGTNCGSGSKEAEKVIADLRRWTNLPLWVKPNAGNPKLVKGKTVFPENPQVMASQIKPLVDAGASIIGGCCGTTPDHIAAFQKVLSDLRLFQE